MSFLEGRCLPICICTVKVHVEYKRKFLTRREFLLRVQRNHFRDWKVSFQTVSSTWTCTLVHDTHNYKIPILSISRKCAMGTKKILQINFTMVENFILILNSQPWFYPRNDHVFVTIWRMCVSTCVLSHSHFSWFCILIVNQFDYLAFFLESWWRLQH